MRRLSLILLALVPCLFGYDRLNNQQTPPATLQRTDNTAIQFYLNNLVVAGATSSASGSSTTVITAKSNPLQAVELATEAWNSVTTASVNFLPVKSTTSTHDPNDCVDVISIAASPSELSAVSGLAAVTVLQSVTGAGMFQCDTGADVNVVAGQIVDSDILLNPVPYSGGSFSTDGSTPVDLQGVLTHEFGHSLSANHSGLFGATMFQYNTNTLTAYINQRYLSIDDMTFVSAAYPAAGTSTLGTISGTVTVGGAPVPFALLTLIDTTQGITIGGLSNADGTYSVQVPPGSYMIYAEPFGIVQPTKNLYLTADEANMATKVQFLSTFLGGNSNPTIVTVAANGTSAGNTIAVTALPPSQQTLSPPYIGFGTAGASGDVKSVSQIGGPVPIASGQSLDLAFVFPGALPGFDATLTTANLQIYGAGITVTNVRVDPVEQFNINGTLFPLVRATVTIPARQSADVATIFISQGSTTASTLSLSGALVITPPTPTFIPASLLNSASYEGPGQVSPGGLYSIYAPTGSPLNLGPAAGVNHAPNYDGYGYLPAYLGGVSVTFDGIAAPLFYVSGGLINLQVPFEVAGKTSTNVLVNFFGSMSAPVAVPVLNEQLAFFTVTPQKTDSIVVNQDGSLNSSTNPAPRGSYVTAYGTGIGVVAGVVTGQGAPPENTLTPNYTCTIGNANQSFIFPAAFVGWTPTTVGLAQFEFQVPAGVAPNTTQVLKCTDTVTGASTPNGTLYVGN